MRRIKDVPSALRRRPASRRPRSKFYIFCEGRNTEPAYIASVKRKFGNFVDLAEHAGQGVPWTLAQSAVAKARALGIAKGSRRKRDSFEEGDQVWAIFDRDEHPRYEEAVSLCASQGINVARSNPCFELWLILHHSDYDKPDDRHQVQSHLRRLRSDYDPDGDKTLNCDHILQELDLAESRAEAQLQRRLDEGSPFGRPSTTMFNLTRAIQDAAAKAK